MVGGGVDEREEAIKELLLSLPDHERLLKWAAEHPLPPEAFEEDWEAEVENPSRGQRRAVNSPLSP